MSVQSAPFYVAGGALPPGAPSYVERAADGELFEALTRGEMCYVLTPRQMGKSSLMVRTAARLRDAGMTVAALDMTSVGHHVTVEQWYSGMLWSLARQVGLEDELDAAWSRLERLGPMQRLMAALRDVVLPSLGETDGTLVLFVDEIDLVRSLPFSADEFFGAIRETIQRRAEDPVMCRLTFCLLGVAAPADLIRNAEMTPFNAGRRVLLDDFSIDEAKVLARGMEPGAPQLDGARADALLERVLWWTGGHPYLTQRLCAAVTSNGSESTPADVDTACQRLFLGKEAQSADTNLSFVAQQLSGPEEAKVQALLLYDRVLRGVRVDATESSPITDRLRLAGVVRARDGHLVVRNRVYRRVFTRAWVSEHTPDQELRRQRAAFGRGVVRTALIAGIVLAVVIVLALEAWRERGIAVRERERAEQSAYVADMNLVQSAQRDGNAGRALNLLAMHVPEPGDTDRRGFEWRYWWGLLNENTDTFQPNAGLVHALGVSRDGRLIASAQGDGTVQVWDKSTRTRAAVLHGHAAAVLAVAFSPNGRWLASGSEDGTARVWDTRTWTEARSLRQGGGVCDACWSADGSRLITAGWDERALGWDWAGGRRAWVQRFNGRVEAVACSPVGDRAILVARGDPARVVAPSTGRALWVVDQGAEIIGSAAFSPDGAAMAIGLYNGEVRTWQTASRRATASTMVGKGLIDSIAWSPDGRRLAVASWDEKVRLCDPRSLRPVRTFLGHGDRATSVGWLPDGRTLVSSGGGTIRLWDTLKPAPVGRLRSQAADGTCALIGGGSFVARQGGVWRLIALPWQDRALPDISSQEPPYHVAWSERAMRYAWATRRRVLLVDPSRPQSSPAVLAVGSDCLSAAWSPDGTQVAVSTGDPNPTVEIWDARTLRRARSFGQKPHGNIIPGLAWSPNGRYLASSGWDGQIVVRALNSGTREVIKGSRGCVNAVAFSPDGRTLASTGDDDALRLWDAASWSEVASFPLPGHGNRISFTLDGRRIVVSCRPDTILWWAAPTLEEIDARIRSRR